LPQVRSIIRLGVLASFSFLALVVLGVPAIQAQGFTQLAGTITGMNTTEDPPILAVIADGGTSYRMRAPSLASVAAAQIGSHFRATGFVVGDTFAASSFQIVDATETAPAPRLLGGQEGIIVGADTESNPPRVMVNSGGASRLLTLPSADRIGEIQMGAVIRFNGSPRADGFQVSEWMIQNPTDASRSSSDDDNDNGDRNGNDNS